MVLAAAAALPLVLKRLLPLVSLRPCAAVVVAAFVALPLGPVAAAAAADARAWTATSSPSW